MERIKYDQTMPRFQSPLQHSIPKPFRSESFSVPILQVLAFSKPGSRGHGPQPKTPGNGKIPAGSGAWNT